MNNIDGTINSNNQISGDVIKQASVNGIISTETKIVGSIVAAPSITATITKSSSVVGSIKKNEQTISATIGVSDITHSTYPIYEGDYSIVPTDEIQTLPSKDTIVKDDIVVTRIPAYKTSNQYGYTFTIG